MAESYITRKGGAAATGEQLSFSYFRRTNDGTLFSLSLASTYYSNPSDNRTGIKAVFKNNGEWTISDTNSTAVAINIPNTAINTFVFSNATLGTSHTVGVINSLNIVLYNNIVVKDVNGIYYTGYSNYDKATTPNPSGNANFNRWVINNNADTSNVFLSNVIMQSNGQHNGPNYQAEYAGSYKGVYGTFSTNPYGSSTESDFIDEDEGFYYFWKWVNGVNGVILKYNATDLTFVSNSPIINSFNGSSYFAPRYLGVNNGHAYFDKHGFTPQGFPYINIIKMRTSDYQIVSATGNLINYFSQHWSSNLIVNGNIMYYRGNYNFLGNTMTYRENISESSLSIVGTSNLQQSTGTPKYIQGRKLSNESYVEGTIYSSTNPGGVVAQQRFIRVQANSSYTTPSYQVGPNWAGYLVDPETKHLMIFDYVNSSANSTVRLVNYFNSSSVTQTTVETSTSTAQKPFPAFITQSHFFMYLSNFYYVFTKTGGINVTSTFHTLLNGASIVNLFPDSGGAGPQQLRFPINNGSYVKDGYFVSFGNGSSQPRQLLKTAYINNIAFDNQPIFRISDIKIGDRK
jgi:hypothetical protein